MNVPPMLAWDSTSIWRVLLLQDYNTRVVLLGTTLLGMCGGAVGVFMLLRRRSLVGDVVGHAALPGIAVAFLVAEAVRPGTGKSVPILMTGALLSGLCGALCVMLIERWSRLKPDAALAIVLSLFYGAGAALLTVVQRIPSGSAAGLKDYLNGKTASLTADDVWLFAGAAAALLVILVLLFKELTLLCFDSDFARSLGRGVMRLDTLLTLLVVGVTIIGMQTVGLILVVAILVIPAASARFWTDDVRQMTWIAVILGGLSAATGTLISALFAKVAAGAVIVLAGAAGFAVSLCVGPRRGLLWRWWEHRRLQKRTGRHDLLRACYELIEADSEGTDLTDSVLLSTVIPFVRLLGERTWSRQEVRRLIQDTGRQDLLTIQSDGSLRLTPDGAALARRAVRNHRLWELYLITNADVAPSLVDRGADRIEHVLGPEVIRELEQHLSRADSEGMPASPHPLGP